MSTVESGDIAWPFMLRTLNQHLTCKIQWLDAPTFSHFIHIVHMTMAPSTGAPLVKQAEEHRLPLKISDLHPRFLVEFNWIFYSSVR